MRYKIAILICLAALGGAPAAAWHAGSGTVTLEMVPVPGSSASRTVEAKNLQDLKGYPYHSPMEAGAYVYKLGLGALAEPLEVTEGTVKLYISRSGADIRVSWEASKYPLPTIFALAYEDSADGKGAYTNQYVIPPSSVPVWKTVLHNGVFMPSFTWGDSSYDDNLEKYGQFVYTGDGKLVNKNQVGAGAVRKEIYYKATINSVEPGDYEDYLPSAEAVGKINYTFGAGNTFFGVPLIMDGTVAQVMSGQVFATGTGYVAGSRIYKQTADRTAFDSADYTASWSDGITFAPDKGYYYYNNGNEISITLVGAVPKQAAAQSLGPGNNLFGVVYPARYGFSIFGSGVAPGDQVKQQSADRLAFDAINPSEFATTTTKLTGLKGYYYDRSVTDPLVWTPPQP
jgi:hypothetical protein